MYFPKPWLNRSANSGAIQASHNDFPGIPAMLSDNPVLIADRQFTGTGGSYSLIDFGEFFDEPQAGLG